MIEAPSPTPRFSVVLPTYRRPDRLESCLSGLRRLEYPPDSFEVLVVDDGGGMNLDAVETPSPVTVKLLTQKHAGPAAARNRGARSARYELLAFVDDDCVPRLDWLTAMARHHTQQPAGAICGHVANGLSHNRFSTASQLLIDHLCDYYNSPNDSRFATSANLVFPTGAFFDLGGFDERFAQAGGEDRDLVERWLRSGRNLRYVNNAIVDHYHDLNLRSFWRQHFSYGRGAFMFHRKRAEGQSTRLRIEPFPFYANLMCMPLRQGSRRPSLTLLVLLSQIANAAGFATEAIAHAQRRRRAVNFIA